MNTADKFICITISPIELSPPSLAIATLRAGGIAILDQEFCPEDKLNTAQNNMSLLLEQASKGGEVGLRLTVEQVDASASLLENLCQFPLMIILSRWTVATLKQAAASLPASPEGQLLLEITGIEQLQELQSETVDFDGLVVRGQESGGWVGEDPAFILLQKVLKQTNKPVYVQGGIGLHTAAACRAAGAAGVILDDQLWLMPESPMPQAWQNHLKTLSGQETVLLGERLDAPLRVLSRPGFAAIAQLQQLDSQCEIEEGQGSQRWQRETATRLGWGDPGQKAWPMGQAVGLAAAARKHYQTTGRYIQAVLKASEDYLRISQKLLPLQPGSPLAISHGTPYPIVQGPMTRVSDTAEFADAVSRAGALPLLALALMRGSQVEKLLRRTKELLGDRPWGIGILGFVPHSLREEQLQVVRQIKPAFALIAGGRPDQAAQLEAEGIGTYIHVPSPKLLELFLEQGARRFVFEGRECGGHVGPLSSFTLWESISDILLRQVPAGAEQEMHILFAGGIHDALSASMIATLAAPLAERGMKVGVLMGSAYLFTQEAVACGAIVEGFQQQLLTCQQTANLETGPGHASRCAVTPFVREFYETRRRMLAAGSSAEEIQNTLESLTLGRLRVASKGIVRTEGGLSEVPTEQQVSDGMYMIGQVATLRQEVGTLDQLHQDVAETSSDRLVNLDIPSPVGSEIPAEQPADIAIIGISTLLPKAQVPDNFWENILRKVNAITEIPPHRWDWKLYYDSNPQAKDKIYSKWGGFLEDVPFDPMRFGIPPKSIKSIEPMQLLTLEAVRRGLADAGEIYEKGDFDRETACVILGASGGMGDLGEQYATRSEIPRMVEDPDARVWERLPEWTEESFPGILMNVTAGRVANRFDLGGSNFTVDAACASSLTAIDLAIRELTSGRSNLAIAGGFDTIQSAFGYFCFSKTQALSPRGKARTFDKDADGIVISEGVAILVLKRLADAERDGDRIYATIKAVASSSDGKGLSLTAPASSGQKRAFTRAYQKAGIPPSTLGLYEAHGTGTVAGDRAELTSIASWLEEHNSAPKSCGVGSVKTMVGHTKSSAGAVAVLKAALALHYKVLPPHNNVENPLEPLMAEDSPVYLLKKPKPWLRHPDYPRRAAVSAFGFGGTNFHAVLEEYEGGLKEPILGAKAWPVELIVMRSPDRSSLIEEAKDLRSNLRRGARPALRDLAYSYAKQAMASGSQGVCLSLVVQDLEQLRDALDLSIDHLEGRTAEPLPPYIQLGSGTAEPQGKIAFLFPGQVAQYPQMGREVALYFQEMRTALEKGDLQLRAEFPKLVSQFIYPPRGYTEAQREQNREQLNNTHVAQAALGIIESGYLELALRLGLQPDMAAGHSYGEYAALYCAGVFSQEDFIRVSEIRGRVMAQSCTDADGAMAALQASREEVQAYLESDVVIANHNSPSQVVVSGRREAVEKLVERLQKEEKLARMLPVSGAFHSPLVGSAQTALNEAIASLRMSPPCLPVYANTTAQPYLPEVDAIRQQLSKHLLSSVEFVEQIKAMYNDGARTFIEIGPKSILTKLVSQILEGQEHTAVAMDGQGRGISGLLIALGSLATRGVNYDLTALFTGRDVSHLNLARKNSWPVPTLSANAWLVNGGSARPQSEAVGHTGRIPALDQAMAAQVKSQISQRDEPSQPLPTTQPARSIHPADTETETLTIMPSPMNQNPIRETAASAPMDTHAALAAYQAYQQTMRQFLSLQEQVMIQFLNGGLARQDYPTQPLAYHQPVAEAKLLNGSNEIPKNNGMASVAPPAPPVTVAPPAPPVTVAPPAPPVTVAPPIVQEKPAPSLDRASLTQTLLNLVSERTGYPAEMLGLDQDMEADLGIDSIKRVEIFGALQKAVPDSLAATLKSQMEKFTQVKTLNGVVAALLDSQPDSSTSNGKQDKSAPVSLDRTSLTQTLLNLVSERTGYPAEMLGLDQDMEADLGIDSIKRVEIFGALQKAVPDSLAATLKSQMEKFTQVKTLNGVVDALLQSTPTVTGAKEASQQPGKSEEVVATQRYVMGGHSAPLPELGTPPLLQGLFLITEDGLGVASQLEAALQELGAATGIITTALLGQGRESLAAEIERLRQQKGLVQGIVHLASMDGAEMPSNLDRWRDMAQVQSKSLFHLLQLCASDLQQSQGQVLAASRLGGQFGRYGSFNQGVPLAGSSSGMLKTMALEWTEVRAKVIDFEETSSAQIAQSLVAEITAKDKDQEIGYWQGQRTVFEPKLVPVSPQNLDFCVQPAADWVVLSIGGARGITAEIVSEMLVPGMTLVLVGRSAEPQPEADLTVGVEDVARLRQLFLQQAREQGKSPTPVQIESQVKNLQRDRDIRSNLESFKTLGAKVVYYSVDVRDGAAFGSLIQDIYQRFGRIDAVIQGAGIIQDKLIVDKTAASFEQVFDTKVDSTFILSQQLRPESLKLAVLFASVAGRTGNIGQCDYASANEVVNRFAWWMNQHWPHVKVMSLNWGPWDVTGMASEEVNRQFRERGVIPIPPASGRKFFAEELRHGQKEDVELIAGIFIQSAPETPQPQVVYPHLPLLLSQPQIQPDSSVCLEQTISLSSDPYLVDHCLDGIPVLPAAVALEYMAELVQAAWPEWVVTQVQNLRFFHGVRLEQAEGKTILLKAIASTHADASSLEVKAEILPSDGARPFYCASFILQPRLEEPPEDHWLPLKVNSGLEVTEAYRNYCFHGPMFQLLTAIAQFDAAGMRTTVTPSHPGIWLNRPLPQKWLFDPGIVDAVLQMTLIWSHIQRDMGGLPAKFGRIIRYGDSPLDSSLRIELRVKDSSPNSLIVDAIVVDGNNHLRFLLEDIAVTIDKSLNRLAAQTATAR